MGSARGSGCTYCESRLASIFCKSRQRNPLFIPPEQNFRAPLAPETVAAADAAFMSAESSSWSWCCTSARTWTWCRDIQSIPPFSQIAYTSHCTHARTHSTHTHALHTHLSPPTPHFFSFVADLDHVLNLILVLVFVLPKKIRLLFRFFFSS